MLVKTVAKPDGAACMAAVLLGFVPQNHNLRQTTNIA